MSTLIIGMLCWTTRNAFNYSLLAMVLSVETAVSDLLGALSNLSGTCIGYGVVAPIIRYTGINTSESPRSDINLI